MEKEEKENQSTARSSQVRSATGRMDEWMGRDFLAQKNDHS